MPSGRIDQTVHIGTASTIDKMNSATLQRPGELGKKQEISGKAYQIVVLDSGATAATGAGVVASGQLAFWKSRSNFIVTNDKVQAIGGPAASNARNSLAGVFTTAVTAGNYCAVQQRGSHAGVATDSGTAAVNDMLVAHTAATAGTVVVSQGTAPTCLPVGKATAATANSLTPCWIGGWDMVEVP